MKYNNLMILMVGLMLLSFEAKAQSIYRTWYSSTNSKFCMSLNQVGYSRIGDLETVKIKLKGNKLKVIDYYNPKALIGGKDIYWMNIDALEEDTLVLTLLPNKHNVLDEVFERKTVTFYPALESCESWLNKARKDW